MILYSHRHLKQFFFLKCWCWRIENWCKKKGENQKKEISFFMATWWLPEFNGLSIRSLISVFELFFIIQRLSYSLNLEKENTLRIVNNPFRSHNWLIHPIAHTESTYHFEKKCHRPNDCHHHYSCVLIDSTQQFIFQTQRCRYDGNIHRKKTNMTTSEIYDTRCNGMRHIRKEYVS